VICSYVSRTLRVLIAAELSPGLDGRTYVLGHINATYCSDLIRTTELTSHVMLCSAALTSPAELYQGARGFVHNFRKYLLVLHLLLI